MKPLEAIDALERQVTAGTLSLRSALAYAWQHGCVHSGVGPWPEYDVRRVGAKWCVVRVADGSVASTWDTEKEAKAAHVRLICSPALLG